MVLLGAMIIPGIAAGPLARADGPTGPVGEAGPLQPPAAALQPIGERGDGGRGLGLITPIGSLAPRHQARTALGANSTDAATASLPAGVDLSQYNPPVGDQGWVQSCVAWATGYYLRGWYARRDGYYPTGGNGAGSFAPMYTYAQIVQGANEGTSLDDNLTIEENQGIDTRADYAQGDYDYSSQPTSVEQTNATRYKIASYQYLLYRGGQGTAAQQAIEASIAGGDPVVLSIPVYDNFYNASPSNYYIDDISGDFRGSHVVFASKYDANGVWIENQWGTRWGLNGWAELSWNFVNSYVAKVVNITPLMPTPLPPTATPVPLTATDTATSIPATATPTNTATSTATATPIPATNTATAVPPTNTATPVPPTSTNTTTPVPPTATLVPPTATPRATPTSTNTATAIPPTSTSTATVTPRPTSTPPGLPATATPPPLPATATPAAPLRFAVTGAAESRQTVAPGGTQAFSVTLTSAGASANALVNFEVHDPADAKVWQTWRSPVSFVAGRAQTFRVVWQVPATARPGTYTFKVGVFTTDWSRLLAWNNSVITCVVSSPATATSNVTRRAVAGARIGPHIVSPHATTTARGQSGQGSRQQGVASRPGRRAVKTRATRRGAGGRAHR